MEECRATSAASGGVDGAFVLYIEGDERHQIEGPDAGMNPRMVGQIKCASPQLGLPLTSASVTGERIHPRFGTALRPASVRRRPRTTPTRIDTDPGIRHRIVTVNYGPRGWSGRDQRCARPSSAQLRNPPAWLRPDPSHRLQHLGGSRGRRGGLVPHKGHHVGGLG